MTEDIISLLRQGYNYKEIQHKLKLDNNELSMFLHEINAKIKSNYAHTEFYSDGRVETTKRYVNDYAIITDPLEEEFNFVIISDTHFGSVDDDIKLLDIVYNYCVKKNIHHIIHSGDLVDGVKGNPNKKLKPIDQIEYVINKYPHDKSIINLINFGNHDFDLISENYPLHQALIDNRTDLIPLAYGTSELYIKNNYLVLKHFIPIDKGDNDYSHSIIIKGHSHRMKVYDDRNNYVVSVPALSNMDFPEKHLPGFLDVKISFHDGCFDNVILKNYGIVNGNLYVLNIEHFHTRYKLVNKDLRLNEKKLIMK